MIINKDGKLFGKISVVDIAVILIIAVLAVGIYMKFGGKTTEVVSTTGQEIECTFLVRNVRMYTVEALQKGGPVSDKTSKEYIGDITDVRFEEGRYQVNMADGTFKSATPDERYNVYVTVRFKGKTGENGYYTSSNKYLSVGATVLFNSKWAQCESTVDSIGVVE